MAWLGMMPAWMLRLATEAAELGESVEETAEESGLSTEQILDSNVINIVVVVGLLIYLGRNVVGDLLANRRSRIQSELQQVTERKQGAEAQLADQQKRLAQAQQQAQQITQDAETKAQQLRQDLLAQIDQDVERIRAGAERDVSSEQDRVAEELRRQIVLEALDKVERDLPQQLDQARQAQLIDRCIQQIGG